MTDLNRSIKFRVEHRVGYEKYEWQRGSILELILHLEPIQRLLRHRVFPNRERLNELLQQCEYDSGMSGYVEWESFQLLNEDFTTLVVELRDKLFFEFNVLNSSLDSSNFSDWYLEQIKLWSEIPFDVIPLMKVLASDSLLGYKQALDDVTTIFYQFLNKTRWHRISHIEDFQINKMYQILKEKYLAKHLESFSILCALCELRNPDTLDLCIDYLKREQCLDDHSRFILICMSRIHPNDFKISDLEFADLDTHSSGILSRFLQTYESLKVSTYPIE